MLKKTFEKWVTIKPNSNIANFRLTHTLLLTKKYDAALKIINKTLNVEPGNEVFRSLEIEVLINKFDFANAQSKWSSLPEELKLLKTALTLQGKIYYGLKKFDQAIPYFLKSYQNTPDGLIAVLLAQSYQQIGNNVKAEQFLKQHLVSFPQDHRARFFAAQLQMTLNVDAAIENYEILQKIDPNNFVVLNNLSMMYLEINAIEKAEHSIEKALMLNAENANLLHTAGLIAMKKGDIANAIIFLEKAKSLSPNNKEISQDYALALKKNKAT